jgi:hypothetical protein
MATTYLQVPLPVQTTSPPDVVGWLTQGIQGLDTVLGTGSKPITVAVATAVGQPLRRDQILYGTVASLPATLPVGTLFCGY